MQPQRGVATARRFIARLRASLDALASPPGRLTRDWIAGRRAAYLAPVSLFLYVNVAFFFVQSASHVSILSWPYQVHLGNDMLGISHRFQDWIAGPHFAADTTRVAVFDAMERVYAKALVIVMLPMVTAAMMLAPTPRRAGFAATFTFVAHYFTFALITLSALFPLVSIALRLALTWGVHPSPDFIDRTVTALQTAILAWYVTRALAMTTALPRWRRALLGALVICASWAALTVYHWVVFATTLVSI